MIGTNDIWRGKTAGLPERLDHLAAALPAGVPVIWSGIPPGHDFRFDLDEARVANKVRRYAQRGLDASTSTPGRSWPTTTASPSTTSS